MGGQKIVLGVTGSVAVYKSCELLRGLIKNGASCTVIMTEAAQRFVTPLTFQALGADQVITSDWNQAGTAIPHIDATRDATLLLIAPATANILAKAAQGIADDVLSAAILAARCPVAFAPAMNTYMWHNNATQRNIAQLIQDGAFFFVGIAFFGQFFKRFLGGVFFMQVRFAEPAGKVHVEIFHILLLGFNQFFHRPAAVVFFFQIGRHPFGQVN